MSYLNRHRFDFGADSQEDARIPVAALRERLAHLDLQRQRLPPGDPRGIAPAMEMSGIHAELGETTTAWNVVFPLLSGVIEAGDWVNAILACECLYQSGHEDALVALGHSLWLSVTFPVDPELTVSQLRYVVEETPDDSDGAAVAAAMAGYIGQLRGAGDPGGDLALAVGQMINEVAVRHGSVAGPEEFNAWFSRLELDNPEKLVVRMRNVIDVLVQDKWWIDRATLQQHIPGGD